MLLNLKEGEYLGKYLDDRDSRFFRFSITSYKPFEQIRPHYHDNSYLSILAKGRYAEKSNHSVNHTVNPGETLFRPASYNHENCFDTDGGVCFNIEFKPGWNNLFDNKIELPGRFTNYRPGHFPSLYKLLINFRQDYNEDTAIEWIADYLFEINDRTKGKNLYPWAEKAKRILDNELDYFHTPASLSERVFVHPVYMARAFKEKTGLTIGEYQLKAKLSNAISLLLTTSLPVSDISHRYGFFDDAHFIRSFKKTYRISPHQFRLSARKLT